MRSRALKDRDVDANAVEDLPPLQCDVPAADDGDALWEVAFVENGLAGVVLDVVEAVNGWRHGELPVAMRAFFSPAIRVPLSRPSTTSMVVSSISWP